MDALADLFNFTYRFRLANDWGIKDENGSWNGLIAMVLQTHTYLFLFCSAPFFYYILII